MKVTVMIRNAGVIHEEVLDVRAGSVVEAMKAAEAIVRERNQHLPVLDREVVLSVRPRYR
jgi:hypothetical protein